MPRLTPHQVQDAAIQAVSSLHFLHAAEALTDARNAWRDGAADADAACPLFAALMKAFEEAFVEAERSQIVD